MFSQFNIYYENLKFKTYCGQHLKKELRIQSRITNSYQIKNLEQKTSKVQQYISTVV